jgi:hypothetical protein
MKTSLPIAISVSFFISCKDKKEEEEKKQRCEIKDN